MGKKSLLWVSLAIVIIIAINEIFWLGKSSLAWVILGITLAIGMLVVYFLSKEANVKIKPLYAGIIVTGIAMMLVGVSFLAPSLNASEVKTLIYMRHPSWYIVSANYKLNGDWKLKVLSSGGWVYLRFNEDTCGLDYWEEKTEPEEPTAPQISPLDALLAEIEGK